MTLVGADMNALGDFGGIHIDLNDDRGHYSLGFFLPNIDTDKVWPGRFFIASVRISCDAEPFSVFVFSAQQPHFGTRPRHYPANLPIDSPLRFRSDPAVEYPKNLGITPNQRLVIVNWPEKDIMRPGLGTFTSEITGPNGLRFFGTRQNEIEYKMRLAIKTAAAEEKNVHTADYWCGKHHWINEEGDREYPRRCVAQYCLKAASGKYTNAWKLRDAAAMSVTCGSSFPGPDRTRLKAGAPILTHQNYVPNFDSKTDTIPGNRIWKSKSRERVHAFKKRRRALRDHASTAAILAAARKKGNLGEVKLKLVHLMASMEIQGIDTFSKWI